jgi:hypothetical protein
MQHAKKMVIVDERLYDELWKRPIIDASKSYLSNKLQADLTSNDISDDLKAKQYQQTLNRFLNQKQELPTPPEKPQTQRRGKRVQWEPPSPRKTKRQKKSPSPSPIQEPRRSKRKTRVPLRWTDLDE